MNSGAGKFIIIAGLLVVIIGLVVYFFHDKLHWIGRLPGDIKIERENFHFYFPIVTMIIFSSVLSLVVYFIKRYLH